MDILVAYYGTCRSNGYGTTEMSGGIGIRGKSGSTE